MIFISNDFFFTHGYGYDCVITIVSKEVVQLSCGWWHYNRWKKICLQSLQILHAPITIAIALMKCLFTSHRRGRFTNNCCCCEPIGITSLPNAFISLSNLSLCTPPSGNITMNFSLKSSKVVNYFNNSRRLSKFLFFQPNVVVVATTMLTKTRGTQILRHKKIFL